MVRYYPPFLYFHYFVYVIILVVDKSNPIPNISNLSINPPSTKPKNPPTATTTSTTTTTTKPGLSNSGGRTSSARAPSPLPPSHTPPSHSTPPNGSISATGKKDEKQASLTKRKSGKPNSPPTSTAATPTKGTRAQPDIAAALTSIAQAGDADARREGLHRLVKLMREDPDLLRSAWFEQILLSLLECLHDESPAMRELALVVLCEMVKASSLPGGPGTATPFEPFINITLARVVEMFRDKDNAHVKQVREERSEGETTLIFS
jgi:hypothetical protein